MSMPDLERIYDRDFFAEWGRQNSDYVESARVIAELLFERFGPRRLVDLGCGCGIYSHLFSQKGVDVVAIDGVRPPAEHSFDVEIELRDLTVPFDNVWGGFDLALCLDVGEHIFPESSGTFLANVTQFSDILLLACAQPGQGGRHHVNEQPKRYWVRRLSEHGFTYNRKRTGGLCETFKVLRPPLMWMWEHISVYERSAGSPMIRAITCDQ